MAIPVLARVFLILFIKLIFKFLNWGDSFTFQITNICLTTILRPAENFYNN